MTDNRRIIQAVFAATFLLIGILDAILFIKLKSQIYFLPFLVGVLLLYIFIAKQYVNPGRLLIGMMYFLVMTTFLNQSVLSIHIGFFNLFLYRIVLILEAIIFLIFWWKEKNGVLNWNRVNVKPILFFLLFWMAYGFVSLLWSKSVLDGFKYMVLIGTGVLFVYLAVFIFQKYTHLNIFYGIWMLMTTVLLILGLINHFGHVQLPTSTLYGGPDYKMSYPTAVFFNQNDFATFLSISFFFYFSAAINSKSVWIKSLSILLGLLSVYIIYLTESRASLLGIMVGVISYLFIILPRTIKKIAVFVCSFMVIAGSVIFLKKITSLLGLFFNPINQTSSNMVRLNLLKNDLHFVLETFGFGVGAGNIPFYLKNEAIYDTNHVLEVHNWLAEIIGNFGIVIFCGYITLYLYLFYSLYKVYKAKRGLEQKGIMEACMLGLISFLVSSISPSSVSNLYFHWVFLGFVISTVNVLKNNQSKQKFNTKGQGLNGTY
ncbi:teichuronic acid biosynthesis protein TuaE [Heyndrickxia camelliae]|uniref:O-antigen ligase-related domain-containing protein n=1 Tax=Heyndrickxia camelliae TaxID=1707093 RepID=A0A2N3LJ90_9BACI|nr:O-antigen ligase family protein [Heyndrickxia camelliae]PKR84609.1 hypothetical protein CWO92_12925 [Heyndrickxia camelliae]